MPMKTSTLKIKLILIKTFMIFHIGNTFGQLSISLPGGNNQCIPNGSITAVVLTPVVGATSYSWSVMSSGCAPTFTASSGGTATPSGYSLNLNFLCGSTTHTITCYAMSGTSTMVAVSQTYQPLFGSVSTVTVGPMSGVGCAGSNFTLVNSGASSYTANPGGITGANIVVSPASTTHYTITATAASGCTVQTAALISINPSPTVTILSLSGLSSYTTCQGSSMFLLAGGATSYTWNTGANSSSVLVTPVVNTCYTVVGGNGCGTSTAVVCISLNAVSPIIITGIPSSPICANTAVSYTASASGVSANSFTWSYTNSSGVAATTGGNIQTLALAPGCVTVSANTPNGCLSDTTFCPNILPSPILTITPTPSIVCEGSTVNYNVSGASSYTWSNGSTMPNINILSGNFANPTSIIYTVTGMNANGCSSTQTISPWMITYTCSNVWPGDANRDGVVSNLDVFELGLWANNTGNIRPSASNLWTSQQTTNWAGTMSTGWNRAHADCNGDGVINSSDTVAIFNNYSLTHSFKMSQSTIVNGDINIIGSTINEGLWNKVDIVLGSSTNLMSQLYGIAFDVNFDQTLIESNLAYIVYTPSFLNAANQNIQFRKTEFNSGKVYAASVRSNNTLVSGSGKIAEFWFKAKGDLPLNSKLNLSIYNPKKVNNSGITGDLIGGSAQFDIVKNTVAVKELLEFDQSIHLFPNPTSSKLALESISNDLIEYTLYDILGKVVLSGSFSGATELNVRDLNAGTYNMLLHSGEVYTHKRVVIN